MLVTLETVQFIQAIYISSDDRLFGFSARSYTEVHSSNLNEDLGQISHVFSDKTGTLTCNQMIFKKLIVKGVPYGGNLNEELNSQTTNVDSVQFTDNKFLNDLSNADKMYVKRVIVDST